jgi:ABC-2 type transport system permease protein
MTAQETTPLAVAISGQKGQLFLVQVFLLVRRSLLTISRAPEALLPPIFISLFFLVIYQSTLGKASDLIPGISGSYLGFILPLSIVSSVLSGAGIAAQNLVRDLERGYFDKLILTPVSRPALLLGPFLAGSVILGIQAAMSWPWRSCWGCTRQLACSGCLRSSASRYSSALALPDSQCQRH